jgi:hypothetical protein
VRPARPRRGRERSQVRRDVTFAIFDSTANLVDSFDDRSEARAALENIVRQDPDAADAYAVFEFDKSGQPVGDAMTVADLGVHA